MTLTIPYDMTGSQLFLTAVLFVFMFFMFRDLRYAVWKAICFGASVTALIWIVARVGVIG